MFETVGLCTALVLPLIGKTPYSCLSVCVLSPSLPIGAAAAVIWRPPIESSGGDLVHNDTLFVMGGFGGWPEDDSRYEGMRCRNDVYKTKDGGEGGLAPTDDSLRVSRLC